MNMRRTRRQYQDSLPVHPRKVTFEEALVKVKRQIKRKAVADGMIVDPSKRPPRHTWAWECHNGEGPVGGIVKADTRSEARSLIKAKLGIPKKRRLPIDTTIIEVEGSKAS
jgi:hypothetical protein